jgi:hypothetical protein
MALRREHDGMAANVNEHETRHSLLVPRAPPTANLHDSSS